MKLASLNEGRDGRLIVVDRLLKNATWAPFPTLQKALDEWKTAKGQLGQVYDQLNQHAIASFPFVEANVVSPLPRAYQWLDGSAYLHHVKLARLSRGAEFPENFKVDPLMYQGASDTFLPPQGQIVLPDEGWGLDFESEIAVVTDDVPQGIEEQEAATHIKLIMLVNDVSLRNLIPPELSKGFGFIQSKPSSGFSPIALTPDELEDAWQNHRVHLPLQSKLNDQLFGRPNAGVGMVFNFAQLIAHAAKTRALVAGTIIGSGTVSNDEPLVGSSCIVEKRMLEKAAGGKAVTPYLQVGDRVTIQMLNPRGDSLFGMISHEIVGYKHKIM